MSLVVSCRRCGREFIPTRADLVGGIAVWQTCPACRQQPPPTAPGDPSSDDTTAFLRPHPDLTGSLT